MLLHTHPINDAREARGALPVNSFWLSGTGRSQAPEAAASLPTVDERLRAPLLAEDWAGWAEAWQALDAQVLSALDAQATRGESVSLSLCGERHARRFDRVRPRPVAALEPGLAPSELRGRAGDALSAPQAPDARRAAARRVRTRAGRRAPAAGAAAGRARRAPGRRARRRRWRSCCRPTRCSAPTPRRGCWPTPSRSAGACAWWPTTTATARRPAPCCCAACACSVLRRIRCTTWCPTARVHGYGLTPAIVDLALPSAARVAGHGGQRHRQPGGRGACARAGAEGAGHRPSPAGQGRRAGAAARGRCHRQPEPARLRLCQQGAGRRGRGVLRAAGHACRTARARRLRGRGATAAGRAARPGGAGHRGRRGQARCQQPAPGGAGPEAHPRRPHALRRGGAVPGGGARPAARGRLRLRLRARPAHQCRRAAVGHDARHRMPAQRRRRRRRCNWRRRWTASTDSGARSRRACRSRPRRRCSG